MRLDLSTWPEIESYLQRSDGVILPTGSTEQHGPIGLIGTDTLCAAAIAEQAAELADAVVVPPLAYTPAPFNMSFPGTLSVSPTPIFSSRGRSSTAWSTTVSGTSTCSTATGPMSNP